MRRSPLLPVFFLLGLTSACGRPPDVTVPSPGGQQASVERLPAVSATPKPTPVPREVVTAPPPAETRMPSPATTGDQPAEATLPAATPLQPKGGSAPTATPRQPRAEVTVAAADQKPSEVITIDSPSSNATVSSPLTLRGSTNFWPFEATLGAKLKDARGKVLAQVPVMVHSPDIGKGGPWSGQMTFAAPAQAEEGTIEVFDASAKDGSILAIARVKVRLAPAAAPGTTLSVEEPAEGATVTLPLHVSLTGAGDEGLTLRLMQDGATRLSTTARPKLGFVVATLPGSGVSGPATLEIARDDGSVVIRRSVRVAGAGETQPVKVAWTSGEQMVLEERQVPRTTRIATAALNELLWGPEPGSKLGTALPTPEEVLNFAGRTPAWGARVRLLSLTIDAGVAHANFSPEMQAYGGGTARVKAIRGQIETTLLQFPTVKQVVIAVDGQTEGVLEP